MFMFHRQAHGPHEAHVQLPFNPLPLSLHEIIICAKLGPRPYLLLIDPPLKITRRLIISFFFIKNLSTPTLTISIEIKLQCTNLSVSY